MSPDRQRLVVAGFGLGQIAAFACSFYLMGVLGDPIARDLGLPDAFVFGTVSLSLLVPAFVSPMVARKIDAGGGKPVLVASHLVFALGLAILGVAQHGAILALGMAVIGFGMALGLSPTPFAILVTLYGEAARRPITAVALIGGLGSTVGWPLTGWVAATIGWRGACFAWAAVQVLVCLPLSAFLCPKAPAGGPKDEPDHADVRWDRPMIQLTVLFACAWFVSTCMSAHLPRLLAAFGMPMAAATAAAGLVGVAAVTVRFLEFTVLRKLPALATTRVATLMHPLGAVALVGSGGTAGAALALGQGAGNGMLTVAKGVLPLSLYGPKGYAYRSALIGRPAIFLQAAGPTVFAVALQWSPVGALALTSALCLVMFAMTFGLVPAADQRRRPAIA
ncbi:MFS transporter [Phenylobacterium sp. J367]|uniref:MFS transporter n=1 Tax=Phenylobacterium sp. J367 TaxID=2898435 RepID=UPI002151A8FD|nr:MFS transporter [Phenylobacterium sp. J367]MCR5880067.1 MFS transporter [Phenylobacterium sp. J367]